ncbi:MAG: PD40 domain-containing protein, partial [Anaerolineales bacterium]|nr:PD40 domain-containing protein [Anaerolineales bacterium]
STAAEPLLNWADFPLPPQANGDWQVTVATAVPQQENWLLFQRHFYYGNIADSFLYNWQTQEVKPLAIDDPFGYPLFSPDGRWLVWQSRGTANSYLFNTETAEQVHTYPNPIGINNNNTHYFNWSADGQWLLRFDQGFMTLNAPTYEYTNIVPYPDGTQLCTSGGWIDSTPTAEPRVLEKPTLPQGTCCLR